MSWFKNRYNKKSAKKLGWEPSWFGASEFDGKLVDGIKEFQSEHDLKADGMCGPMTFHRIVATREASPFIEEDLRKLRARRVLFEVELLGADERAARVGEHRRGA